METSLTSPAIWAASASSQAYVAFRRVVDLPHSPASAVLRVFADTRYRLWINGQWIEDGPCRFDPKAPSYDALDLGRHLHPGANVVALLVHHYALNQFTEWFQLSARMMHHEPGLMLELEIQLDRGKENDCAIVVKSDAQWRCCSRTRFQPSPYSYSSIPDNIDCQIDTGDWTQIDFDDSTWERPIIGDSKQWGTLRPRSIPLLRRVELDARLRGAGELPQTLDAGEHMMADAGRAVQGYAFLEFDADAGSEIEIDYGSALQEDGISLDTGRPWVGGVSRYIAAGGRQMYLSGDTFGFRYLTVTVCSGHVHLHRVRVIDRRYPFERQGSFTCSEPLFDKVWDYGVNTVELCSEDAFVDCADRERAQWIGDGVMVGYPITHTALAAPQVDGCAPQSDLRLFAKMLRDVAASQLPDGRLQPMRPSDYPSDKKHGVIEDYSCLWVHGLRDLYERTGDRALVAKLLPIVKRQMDHVLRHRVDCGLVELEEFIIFTNPLAYQKCQGTGINSCAYVALVDAARLCQICGDLGGSQRYEQAADCLRSAINEVLWDEQVGSYHAGIVGDKKSPPSAHAAMVALFAGIAPPNRRALALRFIRDQYSRPREQRLHEELEPMTLAYAYWFEALYQVDQSDADQQALDLIRHKWPDLLCEDTHTTAEGFARNNVGGCSVLHNFGAVPAYYLSSYVLGVRTQGPREHRQLIIEPRLGDLRHASGTVMTEWGPVSVDWRRLAAGGLDFTLTVPTGRCACVSLPCLGPGSIVKFEDKSVDTPSCNDRIGRWVKLHAGGGTVRGQIICTG